MKERVVDLHIHSHYSRATSPKMNVAELYKWGKLKGIDVLGTGDFTHPEWSGELEEKLEPVEEGLFSLKEEWAEKKDEELPERIRRREIRFVLSVEVSNIYNRAGKVRKLHNVVVVPSFEQASEINGELTKIGNLRADGRPILGMDSRRLLEIVLEAGEENLFFPAHIWTPWFSMLGSKSGFDGVREAFGGLAGEIKAVETGLSSDPAMNWRIKELDGVSLVSNSDAHSPSNLGREANVIKSKLSYGEIVGGIKTGDERLVGTIEFFPQEGKYHWDGHRKCGIKMSPQDSLERGNLCPVCGQEMVLGVDHRVEELAEREEGFEPEEHKRVEYIIPLEEIIAQIQGVKSTKSKAVQKVYKLMLAKLGDEFSILRKREVEKIREAGFEREAAAIGGMRRGEVEKEPGYDGVYGKISVVVEKEEQISLFDEG